MITEKLLGVDDLPSLTPFGVTEDELTRYVSVPGSFTTLVSDDEVPILFIRGKKSLRLDLSINLAVDHERAAKVLIEALSRLADRARANGFTELAIDCSFPELTKLAVETFGFVASDNTLTKAL
ncbi:MAG: hypothetical protein JSS95_06995 [Acidobacteria bacterium]|nr:hypothetical protein [Acidobacteriota bacterium]